MSRRGLPAPSLPQVPDRFGRHLNQQAERIDEPHLLGRAALDVEQLGTADQHGEAAGARDGHVEAVAAEEELLSLIHI